MNYIESGTLTVKQMVDRLNDSKISATLTSPASALFVHGVIGVNEHSGLPLLAFDVRATEKAITGVLRSLYEIGLWELAGRPIYLKFTDGQITLHPLEKAIEDGLIALEEEV